MEQLVITGPDSLEICWDKEPVFHFETEVDALETLGALSEDLRAAREQVRQIMRYMQAAVVSARAVEEDGEKVRPQAIINHSGLSRRTVYGILNEAPERP